MYIRYPELIYLLTESLYPLINITSFPPPSAAPGNHHSSLDTKVPAWHFWIQRCKLLMLSSLEVASVPVCTWQDPNSFTRGQSLGFCFCYSRRKQNHKKNPKYQSFPSGESMLEWNRVWKSPGSSKPQGRDWGGQDGIESLEVYVKFRGSQRIQRVKMGLLQDHLAWSSRLFIFLCVGGVLINSLAALVAI